MIPPILPTPPFLWKKLKPPFFQNFWKLTPPPPPPPFIKGGSNYVTHSSSWFYVYKLYLGHSVSKSELMILLFPQLQLNFLSRGSNRMITTLAQSHCAYTKIPDVINPLRISSGELWSILLVPQRMKIQDKVEFKGISGCLSSTINFEFYPQGYQRLTCYVWRNIQTKYLGTYLCLILRNLQLIKYLKANHLVKNFVIYKFFIPTKFTTPGLGVSKMPHLQQSHAIKHVLYYGLR